MSVRNVAWINEWMNEWMVLVYMCVFRERKALRVTWRDGMCSLQPGSYRHCRTSPSFISPPTCQDTPSTHVGTWHDNAQCPQIHAISSSCPKFVVSGSGLLNTVLRHELNDKMFLLCYNYGRPFNYCGCDNISGVHGLNTAKISKEC